MRSLAFDLSRVTPIPIHTGWKTGEHPGQVARTTQGEDKSRQLKLTSTPIHSL